MYFSTKLLGILGLSTMIGLGVAKPMPQGGYAAPAGPGNGDCAGSDNDGHFSDVLACPAHPEAIEELCGDEPWVVKQGCKYGPVCLGGNFCSGSTNAKVSTGENMVDYYNRMGCNCDG